MATVKDGSTYAPSAKTEAVVEPGDFQFAAAFLDHGHVYGQTNGLRDAGGTLRYVYDPNPERVAKFVQTYPEVKPVESFEEILEDENIHLVTAAAIPNQRAAVGLQVLAAQKDYFTDKSPFTTLEQLAEVRVACQRTGRKYMVYYAERLHNESAVRAGELIEEGVIGRVLQVINLAPHRLGTGNRPDWFFDKACYGGIITDLGSHQVEQFLSYAGCADARLNHARVENFTVPGKQGLEDFGELSLTGDNGASCYARVDWLTPEGQSVWGDGRCFIVGEKGAMELRKYVDVARETPASKLFLVDGDDEHEIDCAGNTGFPFFGELILDVLNRTEDAMTQAHAFKAAELTLQAQALADAQRKPI